MRRDGQEDSLFLGFLFLPPSPRLWRERAIRLVQHAMRALRLLHITLDLLGIAKVTRLPFFRLQPISSLFHRTDSFLQGETYLPPTKSGVPARCIVHNIATPVWVLECGSEMLSKNMTRLSR